MRIDGFSIGQTLGFRSRQWPASRRSLECGLPSCMQASCERDGMVEFQLPRHVGFYHGLKLASRRERRQELLCSSWTLGILEGFG